MHKRNHDDIVKSIEAKGFKLLSQYENSTKALDITCPNGHHFKMSWAHFNGGRGCGDCAIEAKKAEQLSMVKQAFSNAGYTLLAEKYNRNNTRMDCICAEGHQIKMDWASFQDGVRCFDCSKVTRGKTRKANTALKAKASFSAAGYQLLDGYTDSHTPMKFICPNGHESQMSWTNFDSGYRCTYCSKAAPVNQERVQRSFENEGYQLLDKYIGKKKRLRFICPEGHKYSISWDNWNQGYRCAICSGKVITRKDVKDAFNAEGYTLLTHYKNDNTEKLDFVCDQGHKHQITWADFRSGGRCLFCSNRAPVDPEVVEQFFLAAGYTPLDRYIGASVKIPYICPQGHQHSVLWHSFKNGCRCPECQGKIVRHKDVALAFAAEGYELLDTYKNAYTHLAYICPEGHEHSIVWGAFKKGHRCPYCAGMKPSQEQREINLIKKRVAGLVYICLKSQEVQKTFSITGFSSRIAKTIHDVLGVRPDGYHLDHIIPQTFFDFRNQAEIEACWHIDNLRYIPAYENIVKGHRLSLKDVESFSESQLSLLAQASRKPQIFR